jgi:valyl-tRNA synthetase
MPFMTEELWAHTAGEGETRPTLLCHAAWPAPQFEDADSAAEINWLVDLVSGIRSVRSEMNVPQSAIAPLVVLGAGPATLARLARHDAAIRRLARVGEVKEARLKKELTKVTEEVARLHKKLSNEKFVANAPEEIVAAEREKLAEFQAQQAKLQLALSRIRDEGESTQT